MKAICCVAILVLVIASPFLIYWGISELAMWLLRLSLPFIWPFILFIGIAGITGGFRERYRTHCPIHDRSLWEEIVQTKNLPPSQGQSGVRLLSPVEHQYRRRYKDAQKQAFPYANVVFDYGFSKGEIHLYYCPKCREIERRYADDRDRHLEECEQAVIQAELDLFTDSALEELERMEEALETASEISDQKVDGLLGIQEAESR